MHGEEEYSFPAGPPRAGQRLQVCDRVETRYSKPGKRGGEMRFAVIVTQFRDGDGTLVAESRRTLIETAPREAK